MLLDPDRLRHRLLRSGELLQAPHLIDLEVLHVLRRYNQTGEMSDERAAEAISDFMALPIGRHSHEVVVDRVWELRFNFTAHDAAYVALAELLGVRLITTDKRLARSAPGVAELIQ